MGDKGNPVGAGNFDDPGITFYCRAHKLDPAKHRRTEKVDPRSGTQEELGDFAAAHVRCAPQSGFEVASSPVPGCVYEVRLFIEQVLNLIEVAVACRDEVLYQCSIDRRSAAHTVTLPGYDSVMAFLQDEDRKQVMERLRAEMNHPVKLLIFSEPVSSLYVPGNRQCLSCRETEQLIQEVAELSDLIEVEVVNVKENSGMASEWEINFTPTIAFLQTDDTGIRMMGLPSGYEFISFLETLISVSKGVGDGLSPDTVDLLEELDEDVHIKIFSTPT